MGPRRRIEGTVGWGILGCGNIATHALAPAITWSRNGKLVAIASRSAQTAAAKAQTLGAMRAYGSYEDLLDDPEVHAVYIGLPNGLHAEWAKAAARAGKHVLCDKSLTLDEASARALGRVFDDAGLVLMCGFMVRHHPQWELARRLLAEGAIGRVRSVRAWLAGRLDSPTDHRWSVVLGGGALFDVTCYGVNAARAIVGTEPRIVGARAAWRTSMDDPPDRVDESSHALLEFPGGEIAAVYGSLVAEPEQGVVIVGDKGRMTLERPFIPGWDQAPVQVVTSHGNATHMAPGANHFLHQVEHFAAAVNDGQRSLFPAENGVADTIACAAIDHAMRRAS